VLPATGPAEPSPALLAAVLRVTASALAHVTVLRAILAPPS
jgi:hypothetical protein